MGFVNGDLEMKNGIKALEKLMSSCCNNCNKDDCCISNANCEEFRNYRIVLDTLERFEIIKEGFYIHLYSFEGQYVIGISDDDNEALNVISKGEYDFLSLEDFRTWKRLPKN